MQFARPIKAVAVSPNRAAAWVSLMGSQPSPGKDNRRGQTR